MEIVYAYKEPEESKRLLAILRKHPSGTSQRDFEIVEVNHPQALWQMTSSYKAIQRTLLPSENEKPRESVDGNAYLAFSEDDYKVLSKMTDEEDSDFMKKKRQKILPFPNTTQLSFRQSDYQPTKAD